MSAQLQAVEKPSAPPSFNEHWATVDGIRVRYLQGGAGAPLVLVHGLIAAAFSWRFNLEAFAAARTVYALDLPGMGESQRCPMDCSLRGLAAWLLNYFAACQIEHADLLGTSHGGALAMAAAILDAQRGGRRIRSLILAAPVHPWGRGPRGRIGALNLAPAALTVPFLQWLAPPLRGFFLRRVYGDPSRIAPGTAETYAAYLRTPGTAQHALRILRSWHADLDQLAPELARIAHLPALLIWGGRDPAILPSSAAELARHLRNAQTVMLPGVGHLPYEEAPEEFNAAVGEFLAGLNIGPSGH